MQQVAIHSPSALMSLCPYPDLVPEVHSSSGPLLSSSCSPSLNYGTIIYIFFIQCQDKNVAGIDTVSHVNAAYLLSTPLFSAVLTRIFSLETTRFSVVDAVRSCMMGPMMQVAGQRMLLGLQHDQWVR